MGKTNRAKHVKVSHKDKSLKRKIEEPKEKIKDPEDLIDAEGFICLPASEEVPEEVENELQAFRANRVTFNTELSEKLKDTSSLDPKIKDVYSKVGKILRGYRSGKLPNAFKIIPGLEKWMEILELTSPDDWSPQAVYQATKIFVSSMGPKQSQKFLYRTLYNAAKKDIQKHKKLNYHHYLALKKAFYKPAAWIRGILFPLCEEDCTLKEATIIGSVISKVSIPMLHAGAALIKLSDMECTGPVIHFIKVLLQKRYALPGRVLAGVCKFFYKLIMDDRRMPVMWHQALLTLAQYYGKEIEPELKDEIRELIKIHNHPQITPEIRKFLFNEGRSNELNTQ